jgi:hypothetical protein
VKRDDDCCESRFHERITATFTNRTPRNRKPRRYAGVFHGMKAFLQQRPALAFAAVGLFGVTALTRTGLECCKRNEKRAVQGRGNFEHLGAVTEVEHTPDPVILAPLRGGVDFAPSEPKGRSFMTACSLDLWQPLLAIRFE